VRLWTGPRSIDRDDCRLDEAHSIGALGKTGRGATEQCGVDVKYIDVMMGTFTKSYGAMGGYIAGSKELIEFLKANSSGSVYGTAMSPVVARQINRAFEIIEGRDGTDIGARKLQAIKDNANYFRARLRAMGCQIAGDKDSPVIPLFLYNPGKIAAFSRECYKRNLAVVVVGFPATSLIESRSRFCISAGHTREDLDDALERIEEVVKLLRLRYRTHMLG
jgi:serine palmitoyltransferase